MPRREPRLTRKAPAKTSARQSFKPRLSPPRLRVLPLTMIMAMLLCSVKVNDAYHSGRKLQLMLNPAQAQEADKSEKEAEKPAETADTSTQKSKPKPPPSNAPEEKDPTAGMQSSKTMPSFSQVELDILQSLSERREELDKRGKELDLKEKLLGGTELRINDKIAEIKSLKDEVQKLLKRYGKQENTHIESLVKIYENMKPKDAAAIFNELDMPILLEVIDGMSERKAAPILASMSPLKAKEVTSDLADMRTLRPVTSGLDD